MTLNEFLKQSDFTQQKELRRVLLLTFYSARKLNEANITVAGISDLLVKLGFPKPNGSRLAASLKKSRMFVSAGQPNAFKLHPSALEALDTEFPTLQSKSEEVISHDSIVPATLLQKDRAFISSLIQQINASYENNIFDGCAVLMRRLLEILLILAYQENKLEATIQDSAGQLKQLNEIIDDAIANKALALSRNTKDSLHIYRKLGNFSAHKIYYNANRKSIEAVILDYKATIEELLYKSNLRS